MLNVVIFGLITLCLILIGLKSGYYAKYEAVEGAAITKAQWHRAGWWFVSGITAMLAIAPLASLNVKGRSIGAGWKILFMVLAIGSIVAGLIAGASELGIDINAIIISLGIFGSCAAAASETVMNDVVVGLGIISDKDFRLGDIVSIDDFRGEVQEISLRAVKLKDPAGNVRIFRNSEIGSVINLTDSDSFAVMKLPFDPAEDDLEALEKKLGEVLAQVADANPELFKEKPCYRGVDSYNEDGAKLLITARVKEQNIYEAKRVLNRAFIQMKQGKI